MPKEDIQLQRTFVGNQKEFIELKVVIEIKNLLLRNWRSFEKA